MPDLTDAELWGAPAASLPVDASRSRGVQATDKPAPDLGPDFYRDAQGNPFRVTADAPNMQPIAQQPAVASLPSAQLRAPQQAAELSDQQLFGPQPGAPAPVAAPSAPQSDEWLGFQKGFDRPLDNMATWAEQIPGVRNFDQSVANSSGTASTDQGIAAHQQALADALQHGRKPGALGEFLGGVPMGAALGVITGNPFLGGAAYGATNADKPLDPMDVGENAALGGVAGKTGDMLLGGLSRLIAPKLAPAVQTLMDNGVKMTPGQMVGGAGQWIEDAMSHLPLVGDMIKGAKNTSLQTFNQAAINRTLQPIGETLPTSVGAGRAGIDYAATKLSDAYSDILPKLDIGLDGGFQDDLGALLGQARGILPEQQQGQLTNILKNNVLNHFGDDGSITGDAMQAADSKLGYLGRSYSKSLDPDQQQLGDALMSAQDSMRDMVARQNPDYADAINGVRTGWANLVRVEGAGANVGAKEGVFTPGQLAGAVKGADSSVRHNQFAKGDALMQDLSDAGQSVLPSTVPDSGTASRGLMTAALLGGLGEESHMLNPTTIGSGLALAAPYTKLGLAAGRWLLGGDRPGWAPAMADALQKYVQPGARIAAPVLAGQQQLLQQPQWQGQ